MAKREIVGELRKVDRFIKVAETEINRLGVYPRKPWMYPFDLVGFVDGVESHRSVEGVSEKLVGSGFPDEAYGLSRSIVGVCQQPAIYDGEVGPTAHKLARNYVKQHLVYKAF